MVHNAASIFLLHSMRLGGSSILCRPITALGVQFMNNQNSLLAHITCDIGIDVISKSYIFYINAYNSMTTWCTCICRYMCTFVLTFEATYIAQNATITLVVQFHHRCPARTRLLHSQAYVDSTQYTAVPTATITCLYYLFIQAAHRHIQARLFPKQTYRN